jgi:hypothetical protein
MLLHSLGSTSEEGFGRLDRLGNTARSLSTPTSPKPETGSDCAWNDAVSSCRIGRMGREMTIVLESLSSGREFIRGRS